MPKRTFQGKFAQLSRDNMNSYNINNNNNINNNSSANNNTTSSYSPHKYRLDKYKCNDQSYTLNDDTYSYLDKTDYSSNIYNNHNSSSGVEKHREKMKYHSVSSASYDDIGDTDDLVLFEKKIQSSIDSNRSSSDSNRSQTTIDTGYVSSNDTDRSVFTNGTSASVNRSFRSRFSSEDTQSSMDSFLSSDMQRTDTIDSLQANDSPFSLKKNVFNFDQKVRERDRHNNYEDPNQKYQYQPPKPTKSRRLPVVPARKPKMMHAKLPSPGCMSAIAYNNGKMSESPPMLPSNKPSPGLGGGCGTTIDTGKIYQCGQMLRNKNFHHNTNKDMNSSFNSSVNHNSNSNSNNSMNMNMNMNITNSKNGDTTDIQEMCTRPMGGIRKGINNANKHKPPPLNQMHPTKMNQRQDSNISSDSYSLTSSPGYNSKTMEAPLLQHASKINKSSMMRHQDSNDSFSRVARVNITPHGNRQDSNISSDSYSQSSSPGYNTKLIDTPLLAHTGILHSSEC